MRAAVLRAAAVVAHHEHVVVGHEQRLEVLPAVVEGDDLGIEVRLDQRPPIDLDLAVRHLDGLARQRDHALDQVALGCTGDLVEHDDVTAVRVVQPVRQLVDEHPITGFERRVHRRSLDHEMGEHERAHDERHEQGDRRRRRPSRGTPWRPATGGPSRVRRSAGRSAAGRPRRAAQGVVHVGTHGLRHGIRTTTRICGSQRLSISRSTRSSRLLNGSLHSTVRCAWSLSLRCTQSTV